MDIAYLSSHPEELDKETLYDLRALLALYPYFQPARLLMLKNLYLLHDPTFDGELRSAAVYITDRTRLFDLVEAAHYQLKPKEEPMPAKAKKTVDTTEEKPQQEGDRTMSLIDDFLDSLPDDSKPDEEQHRKPTPADATQDYVAYLLETESDDERRKEEANAPQMKGQNLIDDFIYKDGGKMELKDEPEYTPDEEAEDDVETDDSGYFTETLAKIYIKQGRYSKALEIIRRLNLIYPKKNSYFADQIRFLEKLIVNDNKKQ